jgi:hypothetical protein
MQARILLGVGTALLRNAITRLNLCSTWDLKMSEITILDVPFANLHEWLVSRKKISKKWHDDLRVIGEKLAHAITLLPPGNRPADTTPLNFLQVQQLLKRCESEHFKSGKTLKTFMGNYNDPLLYELGFNLLLLLL